MLDAVGDAEAATHDARRSIEAFCELLSLIRGAVELPDDIVAKIDAALRGVIQALGEICLRDMPHLIAGKRHSEIISTQGYSDG